MRCEHYACRCMRAEELAQMCDRTGNVRHLIEALGVHSNTLECRLAPAWVLPRGGRPEGDGDLGLSLDTAGATEAPGRAP